MRVIETGGDTFEAEREQWDDGNNVVALEPGVVVAYERNVGTNTALRRAGIEVITIEGYELGRRSWWLPLHDLPPGTRRRLLRTASVGSTTVGPGRSSRRMSPGAWMIVPRMGSNLCGGGGQAGWTSRVAERGPASSRWSTMEA
jgi:hypothetical protein